MDVAQTLIDFEMELVNPSARDDRERIKELLAEDFEEFGSSGKVITKADVLKADGPVPAYELSDFSVHMLGERAALVKYRASIPGHNSHRSSVWVKCENRWQMLHHQSTVVPSDV
ncbi:nuclear transport factor 2 family protein [Chromohalobacter canadensis]|uniref:nuclear transport factor 2 family protein n=1 Tax=Chromohalobacter canadensis TaxID=141389 RepID=UPI0024103E1F|nr:nuclear transport factor 2 family protein [Chromohalobacter canadensis]